MDLLLERFAVFCAILNKLLLLNFAEHILYNICADLNAMGKEFVLIKR
jgi:hypothetical protein